MWRRCRRWSPSGGPGGPGVRLVTAELGAGPSGTPLIGFAGAPFTCASYLWGRAEPQPRAHQGADALRPGHLARAARSPRRDHPDLPARAAGRRGTPCSCSTRGPARCPSGTTAVRAARTRRGCGWAGRRRVPRIHFGVGTGELLARWPRRAPTWSGWTGGCRWTWLPGGSAGAAVQGNLDPSVLFAGQDVVDAEVRRIMAEGRAAHGHVFNLGHGVLPETDPDVLSRVVELGIRCDRIRRPRDDGSGGPARQVHVAVVGGGISGLAGAYRLRTLLGRTPGSPCRAVRPAGRGAAHRAAGRGADRRGRRGVSGPPPRGVRAGRRAGLAELLMHPSGASARCGPAGGPPRCPGGPCWACRVAARAGRAALPGGGGPGGRRAGAAAGLGRRRPSVGELLRARFRR